MKPLTFTLLRLLADGEFHSGEALAQQIGMSRASVNNALQGVEAHGLTLYSVRGRGYRLVDPPQWLDVARITAYLGKLRKDFHIEILDAATSSNTLLLKRAAQDAPCGSVLAVEWQGGGRGRLGRTWYSGLGNALTFSVLWRFACGLSALSGLSLAAGVAVMRALHALGVEGACLKWPNDVLGAHGKLAGILIEAQGDMLGPSAVVIGIGLNLSLPRTLRQQIGQPVTTLAEMTDKVPERNYLLAVLLRELHGVLREFEAHGFAALREEWTRYHGAQDQPVQLLMPDGSRVEGIARGVAEDGALELETKQGARRFNAGEVSLRSIL
ncbi:MAG: biotin--[acetyl-CoA-carboxylase] ligase [Nitrosomonadales bacterium]|nr:biotin--[acetyl-CoA-carboxylase] ligase [Nitrosomonadales bacterium]